MKVTMDNAHYQHEIDSLKEELETAKSAINVISKANGDNFERLEAAKKLMTDYYKSWQSEVTKREILESKLASLESRLLAAEEVDKALSTILELDKEGQYGDYYYNVIERFRKLNSKA